MPNPKRRSNTSRPVRRDAKSKGATTRKSKTDASPDGLVFLNIGVSKQSRAGLNKLVGVMKAANQRGVLEQLIATELHRHNLRLPRVA
jgi:hypothetical protein